MPTTTATRPPNQDAHTLAPGISTAEADLIATTARRFLDRADTGFHEVTMAVITYQIGTLFAPYTPAAVDNYSCVKSADNTHYCTIS